jgi:hypothetical protein
MRGKLALFGGFGPVFLIGGLIAGVGAVANASTVSAYHHATVCPSGAALDADCLQTVDGSVSGVTEVGGKDAHYALYVQVGSRTLDVTFGSDNQMLGYAADGDSAKVSVWRGIPVAVQSNGYSEIPNSVPASSASDWVLSIGCLVLGFVILLGSLLKWRRERRTGTWVPPSRSAAVRQSRPKPVSVRQQLPAPVHPGITAAAFPRRPARRPREREGTGPPGSRARRFRTCHGSLTARGPLTARDNAASGVAFHHWDSVGAPASLFSRLNSPACACPCQRFATPLTGRHA